MKIVVPIPPVDGRAESLLSGTLISIFSLFSPADILALGMLLLIEYPSGASVSVIL